MNNSNTQEFLQSLGAFAEISFSYYRATLGAGATPDEAKMLTEAFITASFRGNQKPPQE